MPQSRRSREGGLAVAQRGSLPHSSSPTKPWLWGGRGKEGTGEEGREGGIKEGGKRGERHHTKPEVESDE